MKDNLVHLAPSTIEKNKNKNKNRHSASLQPLEFGGSIFSFECYCSSFAKCPEWLIVLSQNQRKLCNRSGLLCKLLGHVTQQIQWCLKCLWHTEMLPGVFSRALWFWTEAEAEIPTFWPPDANSWLIGNDPDAGKNWRQEEKGTTEDEMVGWHHWYNGHELGQTSREWSTRRPVELQSMGLQRVGHDWTTELNWTEVELETFS